MTYRIEFSWPASRQFDRVSPQMRSRLARAIDALANDPLPQGSLKLSGQGDRYRIRVGDYRVIYSVRNDMLVILIVSIGHRREVYRDL